MTLRYDNLEEFMAHLKKMGYRNQIPRQHLDFFIAKKFGTSKYIKDNIAKTLVDLGFLTIGGIGIFNICNGWQPDCVKKKVNKE